MDKVFSGVDCRPVHHFHAARNDPGADDVGDAFAGRLDLRETDHQGSRRFRLLQDPDRDLGDHAEQAFRSGDDSHQIVTTSLGGLAADPDDFAGD